MGAQELKVWVGYGTACDGADHGPMNDGMYCNESEWEGALRWKGSIARVHVKNSTVSKRIYQGSFNVGIALPTYGTIQYPESLLY